MNSRRVSAMSSFSTSMNPNPRDYDNKLSIQKSKKRKEKKRKEKKRKETYPIVFVVDDL